MVNKEYNIQKNDLLLLTSLLSVENISLIFKYFLSYKNNTTLNMSTIKHVIMQKFCIVKCLSYKRILKKGILQLSGQ